jgi:OPA family glycerol-3-phosphate transporter-like MFS transporter
MEEQKRLHLWQALAVGLMVLGYAGYYICRSNLPVVLPLLIQEMAARGIPASQAELSLGTIASLGVLAYAIGKFPSGSIADFLGGRRNFLMGMGGSIAFTILFALGGGLPLFTLAWIGNRFSQSLGWAGIVKITSKWFPYASYGTVMGIISLSFLFGDAAARQFMGVLIAHGLGWRGVFYAAAATLGVLMALNAVLLRESPEELGLPEPAASPENLFGAEGEKHRPPTLGALLGTFARSRMFWLVCLISLGVTLVRETFNLWTPTYFTQVVGLSNADAAQKSALFPLFGGISVILAGFSSDRLGRNGRSSILFWGLLLAGAALGVMGCFDFAGVPGLSVWLVALVGFLIIGPYSYLAGAMSLDFGGKQGSATASGFIDGVGYLGGVLAGNSMASVSIAWGWRGAFLVLAAAAWLASLGAGIYWWQHSRQTAQGGASGSAA